jgi:hypothetical protein
MAVKMWIMAFWVMMPSSPEDGDDTILQNTGYHLQVYSVITHKTTIQEFMFFTVLKDNISAF